MHKAIKIAAFFPFLLGACITLTSCTSVYSTDYTKEFSKYLDYSLGKYQIASVKTDSGMVGQEFKTKVVSTDWKITYSDINGQEQTLKISNYSTHGSDAETFGSQIFNQAKGLCEAELEKNVVSKYFESDESQNDTYASVKFNSLPVGYSSEANKNNEYYTKYINATNGIKLRAITAKEMVNTWNLSLDATITTNVSDRKQLDDIIEKSKLLLKDLSNYLNINDISCNISGDDDSHDYILTYNKSENKSDVHSHFIQNLVINGESMSIPSGIMYNNNQYYACAYYQILKNLFKDNCNNENNSVEWKIGNNTYKIKMVNGTTGIFKNDSKESLTSYDVHKSDGITIDDFEKVTNSKIEVDEKNHRVIITSNP